MNVPQADTGEWCFIDRTTNEPKGPVPLRDLEVLWETGEIDSQTFVWKQGLTEWKKIADIPDLRKRILEDTYVPANIQLNPGVPAAWTQNNDEAPREPQKVSSILKSNKEENEEDKLDTLERKFEKIKENFYQGPDGLWYVLDPETGKWKSQTEAPNIAILNDDILDDLLEGLGGDNEGDGKKNRNKDKKKVGKTNVVDLDTLTDEQIKKLEKNKKKAKKQAEKKKAKWYSAKMNSSVYAKVEQGLPDDATFEELKEFFGKAGVIRLDLKTGAEKIKIYKDDQERPKGDALISYLKNESVDLAMEILNEAELRPGARVFLERAQFEQKGDYVPRKKVKEDKVMLTKIKNDQDRLLSWGEDEAGEGLKIVIILNMFSPEEVDSEENFVENLQQDVLEECEEKLGPVHRIVVYGENPNGAVQIKFKDSAAAEGCIKLMNGRFFAGKQLDCFYWDGKTDYKRRTETAEDEAQRLEDFGKWIEGDDKEKVSEITTHKD